jgi:hypothetical protein
MADAELSSSARSALISEKLQITYFVYPAYGEGQLSDTPWTAAALHVASSLAHSRAKAVELTLLSHGAR